MYWPQWRALLPSLTFQPVAPNNPLYFSQSMPLGWTLNFEMYFYLLFGLCLLLRRWRWLALALASKTIALAPPAGLVWLGTISFSLYLTHTTTQLLVTRGVEAVGGHVQGWPHVLPTTAVAVSVAAAVHHYLEERLSGMVADSLRRLLAGRKKGPAGPLLPGTRGA